MGDTIDTHTTLQLDTPCTLAQANQWWAEVNRVMGDEIEAVVSVINHADGTPRITVYLSEEIDGSG